MSPPKDMLTRDQQDRMTEWGQQVRDAAIEDAAEVAESAGSSKIAEEIRKLRRAA